MNRQGKVPFGALISSIRSPTPWSPVGFTSLIPTAAPKNVRSAFRVSQTKAESSGSLRPIRLRFRQSAQTRMPSSSGLAGSAGSWPQLSHVPSHWYCAYRSDKTNAPLSFQRPFSIRTALSFRFLACSDRSRTVSRITRNRLP